MPSYIFLLLRDARVPQKGVFPIPLLTLCFPRFFPATVGATFQASEATKDPILRDSVHYLWTICYEPFGHSNGAAVVFDRLKSFLVLQYLLFTTKFLQSPSIELPLVQKNWNSSTIYLKYCSSRLTCEKYVLYLGLCTYLHMVHSFFKVDSEIHGDGVILLFSELLQTANFVSISSRSYLVIPLHYW